MATIISNSTSLSPTTTKSYNTCSVFSKYGKCCYINSIILSHITYFLNIPTLHHSMAVNLSKMKAIRDAFHRTPCAPDSDRYLQFEKSFTFDPTEDQKSCFQVSNFFYAILYSIYIRRVFFFHLFTTIAIFKISVLR